MKAGTGPLLVIGGMAIIGLTDNFILYIAQDAGLWQFHAVRSAMALGLLVALALFARRHIRPKRMGPVIGRSVFFAASMLVYFGSIPLMPIALVVAGLFTAPAFILIFSTLLFDVRPGPIRILAVGLGFAGVLLILNPGGDAFSLALLLPIVGGALYAMSSLTARHWCADESTESLLATFYVAIGIAGVIGAASFGPSETFAARGWVSPSPAFLFWCFVQAATSILAVGMLTRAYQMGEPTFLAIYEYSLLIFVSIWAFFLHGQTVSPQEILGMIIIAVSGAIISIRSARAQTGATS